MMFRDRPGRLGPARAMSAALLAASMMLAGAGAGFAQQRPPRPAQQPAQPPAQPAQPPAAPADPAQAAEQGTSVVQLRGEPSQTDWLKQCGRDTGRNKQVCFVTRDFVTDQNQPVLAVAVYEVEGDPSGIMRILLPPGLLLRPGIRFVVDRGQPTAGQYSICMPNGCFAEAPIKADIVKSLKTGKLLQVSVQNQVARQVTFVVPLEGFQKAMEGPAADPKEVEERQKKMQEQLAKQQEEIRKRMLEQQRSQLPPGAPGATPAPAAPAAPPKQN
jgi:invasion protein IalB